MPPASGRIDGIDVCSDEQPPSTRPKGRARTTARSGIRSKKPAPGWQDRMSECASWQFRQAVEGSLKWDPRVEFDKSAYASAVEASSLKPKEKATVFHMLHYASSRGVTTVSRYALAELASVSRAATIGDRWTNIRKSGFLNSRQRMDKSSVHVFTMPTAAEAPIRAEGADANRTPGSASFLDLGVTGWPGSGCD